jgi:hypothetical protein
MHSDLNTQLPVLAHPEFRFFLYGEGPNFRSHTELQVKFQLLCFRSLRSDVAEVKTEVCRLNGSHHSPTVVDTGTNKNE